jgi:hypothetical protein
MGFIAGHLLSPRHSAASDALPIFDFVGKLAPAEICGLLPPALPWSIFHDFRSMPDAG